MKEKHSNFKYYQPNKKDIKDKYGDCVIRALTKAMDKTWVEVFDELVPIAREVQCYPSNDRCWIKYLENNGFVKGTLRVKAGQKRFTPSTFASKYSKGTYALSLAHHLVTVVDGTYYDTWDCGDNAVYTYWKKEV